ncbi:MAG: hypothetical protein JW904_15850 [Spirochaetales bacterium]|nr:hypothetical protein [Spirochaetales bacterium]
MFFIRTWHFIFLVLIVLGLLVFGSVAAYMLLTAHNDKLNAERVLFFGITGILAVIMILVRLMVYNRQTMKKMEKLLDLVTQNGILPLERLATFGGFGNKMQQIYSELVSLSNRKSSRIIQLNSITDKLMEFIDIPLLIVDATGEIRKTSGGFLEKNKLAPGEIIGNLLASQIEGIDFSGTLFEAKQAKGPIELELEKKKYTFYPVFSETNDIVFFLVAYGKHQLINIFAETGKKENYVMAFKPKKSRFTKLLRFFLGDKKKKEKE